VTALEIHLRLNGMVQGALIGGVLGGAGGGIAIAASRSGGHDDAGLDNAGTAIVTSAVGAIAGGIWGRSRGARRVIRFQGCDEELPRGWSADDRKPGLFD